MFLLLFIIHQEKKKHFNFYFISDEKVLQKGNKTGKIVFYS